MGERRELSKSIVRMLLLLQQRKSILGCSTRNRKLNRLKPHYFQTAAARSRSKDGAAIAVALPYARERAAGSHIRVAAL